MLRSGLLALACALMLVFCASAQAMPRVVVAFMPSKEHSKSLTRDELKKLPSPPKVLLKRFENRPELAIGYLNATQGSYSQRQALLDQSQGTRVSATTYDSLDPPRLYLRPRGAAGVFEGWFSAVKRANSAPANIVPGLLGSAIPGGAGYAGPKSSKSQNLEAIVAADRGGRVAALSLGTPQTVAARALRLLRTHRLVVVGLPPKREGGRQLDALLKARAPDELLIVMQTPPDFKTTQLLPMGIVGPAYKNPHRYTSATTRRMGIVAGIDIAPTVLHHLGLKIAGDVSGQSIEPSGGSRSTDNLEALKRRLAGISKRRIPAIEGVMIMWIGLLFALGAAGGWHATRRRGLRIGALAVLWSPTAVLVSAVVDPKRALLEVLVIMVIVFVLAALTDRFVAWPRGPAVPAFAGLFFYVVDLFRDSDLIARSLLGPNPRFGSRFFGLGNELETALPILLLVGLAAACSGMSKSRRLAAVWALAGVALAVVVGAGRLGADVGGVITVGAGFAAAVLVLIPDRISWRMIAVAVVAPILALGALALLDLATGGNGHFTRSVLHADSFSSVVEIVKRRYELAFTVLTRGRMPALVLFSGVAVVFAYRNRKWLFDSLDEPVWRACLLGSLSLSMIGSLFNDSGPLLFIIGVFALGTITAYIQGDPALAADADRLAPVEPTKLGDALADDTTDRAPEPASASAAAGVTT